MTEQLKIYDASIDEYRPATQKDIYSYQSLGKAYMEIVALIENESCLDLKNKVAAIRQDHKDRMSKM